MKVVILAGGLGTRLSEETDVKPKPMVEIGGRPILWHIMKIYSQFGFNEFVICGGYKREYIVDYFTNYASRNSDVTIDLGQGVADVSLSSGAFEPWKIHVIDTGKDSMTGGRLKRVKHLLEKDENFMMTYGDGVADIDIKALLESHEKSNKLATVTATYPSARFGALDIQPDGSVSGFKEKPTGDGNLINGGYFVLSTKVLDLIKDDSTVWEQEPMVLLASQKQLNAFVHKGFWTPMDTLRDKHYLNELLESGAAPWKTWD